MTRKELKKVRDLNNEIRMWEQKLRELNSKSLVGSPSLEDKGSTPTRNTESQVERLAMKRVEIVIIMSELKERAEQEKINILYYISSVSDPILRQILMYRFVECYSWAKVSVKMHISEDAAKQIYRRGVPE